MLSAEPPPSPATIEGELERSLIDRIVRAHRAQLRACATSTLPSAQLPKALTIEFVIDARGRTSQIELAASPREQEELRACVAGIVREWRFPKPEDGGKVRVIYPLALHDDAASPSSFTKGQ
nr:AgmX/PglI C-terminal domain-containing protein [Pseudenhygromyxa sp. WMMC2535]